VKTDSSGQVDWSHTYGGSNNDEAYVVIQTEDGGYLIAGNTIHSGEDTDWWIVKTDEEGSQTWNCTYGGSSYDRLGDVYYFGDILQTTDSGYLLLGQTESYGEGASDVWLMKVDSNGSPQWNHTYGTSYSDFASSIITTLDGGHAIGGYRSGDIWLFKTNTTGHIEWSETNRPSSGAWWATCVIQTNDGGFMLSGHYYRSWPEDIFLLKTGTESGLIWTNSTENSITVYRGLTDPYWNYVRIRIWKLRET
jgi:hypothetical protein